MGQTLDRKGKPWNEYQKLGKHLDQGCNMKPINYHHTSHRLSGNIELKDKRKRAVNNDVQDKTGEAKSSILYQKRNKGTMVHPIPGMVQRTWSKNTQVRPSMLAGHRPEVVRYQAPMRRPPNRWYSWYQKMETQNSAKTKKWTQRGGGKNPQKKRWQNPHLPTSPFQWRGNKEVSSR